MVGAMSDQATRPAAGLSRREAIASAILLVAGVVAGPAACSRPLEQGFFRAREMRLLDALCETILPQTDTPGARAAKVHEFIDGMMTSWASQETARAMRALLQRIDSEASASFSRIAARERTDFVPRFDAAAFAAKDAAWAQF